jgi:hypothetical protein
MMPATSLKQKKFMDAAAHNPEFAQQAGIPVSVAKDFSGASKGMKFGKDTNTSRPDLQKINKPKTLHGKMSVMKGGGTTMNAKMKMFEKSGKDVEKKGMKEGSKADMAMDRMQMMGMKKGGMAEGGMSDKSQDKAMIKKAFKQHDAQEHKGGKGTSLKLAKGGTFRASANGVATKGKTKGTMIKMNMGGKPC